VKSHIPISVPLCGAFACADRWTSRAARSSKVHHPIHYITITTERDRIEGNRSAWLQQSVQ